MLSRPPARLNVGLVALGRPARCSARYQQPYLRAEPATGLPGHASRCVANVEEKSLPVTCGADGENRRLDAKCCFILSRPTTSLTVLDTSMPFQSYGWKQHVPISSQSTTSRAVRIGLPECTNTVFILSAIRGCEGHWRAQRSARTTSVSQGVISKVVRLQKQNESSNLISRLAA